MAETAVLFTKKYGSLPVICHKKDIYLESQLKRHGILEVENTKYKRAGSRKMEITKGIRFAC
jgi:hypothetical protein